MAIIAVLFVALKPVVNSLSKSSGRKGAINSLTSTIEQARSLALTDARNTYVVFAALLPGSATPGMIQDYSFRSYAIFEDNASGAGTVQITKWQRLPIGISFRSVNEPPDANGNSIGTCLTSTSNTTTAPFSFPPLGSTSTLTCPYIEFDATGGVVQPATASPMRIIVFEGKVDTSANEMPTARESSGDPVRDEIQIERFTGRTKYVIR